MIRRMALAALCLFIASGCALLSRPAPAPTAPAPPPAQPAPEPLERPNPEPKPTPPPPPVEVIPPGSFDYRLADGLKLRVLRAEGAMPTVRRTVQLLRHTGGVNWQVLTAVNVPHLPGETVTIRQADLPGYPGAFIIEARRWNGARHGAVAVVGGQLLALDYHRLVAPKPEIAAGVFLHLSKYMNQLWVYRDGALVASYPTANGRDPWGTQPTWQDLKTNYKTPEGLFPIKQKIVNPPYNNFGGNHKPVAGGAPGNPLGTRWMGFEVLPGDSGGVWGFHGTAAPDQIGTWASEGCVRLNTADAEKLFDMLPMGAMVRVASGK